MKDPVDHILRPVLPWRPQELAMTECGYDASKVSTLTREAHFERVKNLGKQRAAMLTCMTCSQTAERWPDWKEDPRRAIGREVEWETSWRGARNERGELLKAELLAIAEIVAMNREQFDKLVERHDGQAAWVRMKDKLKLGQNT